jgi:hypothetical protein
MPFFFYDPERNLRIARPMDRDQLIAALDQLPPEQDVFVAVLHGEHRGLLPYVRALRGLRERLELPASASGFVPEDGPWKDDHDGNATPPNPSHGAFQMHSALSGGSVLGQLLMIPTSYTPLANTSWIGREYWRWTSTAWPDSFFLRPEAMATGNASQWSAWSHGAFSAPSGTVDTSTGALYRINLVLQSVGPPGTLVGCLWRRTDGKLMWFADEAALDSEDHFALPSNSALGFQKITNPPSGINDLWRYLADPASI